MDQIHVFSQGSGSATFVGNIVDVFVRLFSSGGLVVLGSGDPPSPEITDRGQ